MEVQRDSLNHEREAKAMNGWGMLVAVIVMIVGGIALLIVAAVLGDQGTVGTGTIWGLVIAGIVLLVVGSILSPGFFTLEPNETRVLVLFGDYKGTVRQGGFRWANPFYSNGPTAKVSDRSSGAMSLPVRVGGQEGPEHADRARSSRATRCRCGPAP